MRVSTMRMVRDATAGAVGIVLLLPAFGCRSPKSLETRSGLHETVSLQAEAIPTEKGWDITLPLPLGNWKIEPFEDQAFSVLPGEPASTLKWTVSLPRWENHQKPFIFELVGTEGQRLPMTIRYPKPTAMAAARKVGETILHLACLNGLHVD